nr:uncharacterized protein LOC108071779 isoform X2 [Drosophila kikkawai]
MGSTGAHGRTIWSAPVLPDFTFEHPHSRTCVCLHCFQFPFFAARSSKIKCVANDSAAMDMERELEMEGSTSEDLGRAKARSASGEESLGSSSSSSSGPNSWTILPVVRERGEGLEEEELPDPGRSPADKHANDRCNRQVTDDSPADDISDGISIISDCESTDRISPNLFLRQPLVDLGFSEMPTGPIILGSAATTSGVQQLEERQDFNDGSADSRQRKQREHEEVAERVVRSKLEMKLSDLQVLPPLVQSGLTAIFYVVATLAILAFVGKLRHPEWQVLGNDKPLADLERRVGDLELQNNLLRAEIDIMSKQLQYLGGGGGGGGGQEAGQRQSRTKGKTFKAWPGNGDSVQPVDITKTDLKKSFQCEDGQFVEIAAMCLESKPPHAESLADEIGDAVNDVLQQSRAFHNFEKVTEKLGTLSGGNEANGSPPQSSNPRAGAAQDREQPRRENASKERYKPRYKQEHSHERKKQGRNTRSREQEGHSDEQRGKYRKYNDHGSRERFNKNGRKPMDNSHEGDDKDNDSGSGEWHERMMQHREHARHKQAQKRNNNWYIERGDSREQMRSGEKGR